LRFGCALFLPCGYTCWSSFIANGMTTLQYLNSQLGALYELHSGTGTGKLGAVSGKAGQRAALDGLQNPPMKGIPSFVRGPPQ
jgi:hypothetical protein